MCKSGDSKMAKYQKQLHFSNGLLHQLVNTENSCVEVQKSRKHVTLFPYHLKNIVASIKEILDEDIAKFHKDLEGILLGYRNIKLMTDLGAVNNDSCFIHLDIEADFVLFKPVPGKELPAIVTKKSKDHVGCLVYHTFNISLPKPENIKLDWIGNDVQIGQEIIVKVTFVNLDAKLPYIRGEFLNNVLENEDIINEKINNDDSIKVQQEPKLKRKAKLDTVIEDTQTKTKRKKRDKLSS